MVNTSVHVMPHVLFAITQRQGARVHRLRRLCDVRRESETENVIRAVPPAELATLPTLQAPPRDASQEPATARGELQDFALRLPSDGPSGSAHGQRQARPPGEHHPEEAQPGGGGAPQRVQGLQVQGGDEADQHRGDKGGDTEEDRAAAGAEYNGEGAAPHPSHVSGDDGQGVRDAERRAPV